ncbi:hypothetical protein NW762_013861 [Fusarium torreyae]|uniref:Polyketide cyclase n=1 Tax=Fusarium torreyae TaxID=1237075 RepID=A0A9W8V9W0_9HYPO|nr:hypothetical protein NW762_013861 [Fusarium torreyae]
MSTAAHSPDQRIVWPSGHSPASAAVFAHNEVHINASPERVWSLLIDCTKWPQWYKHCTDVSVLDGGHVLQKDATFRFKTLRTYFQPKVVIFEPYTSLVWEAQGPAWTSGAHAWHIEPSATGCKVITEEAQRGLLLSVIGGRVKKNLEFNHEDWLQSLKALAESS